MKTTLYGASTYYGIAAAHVGRKFNTCVLQKRTEDKEINKSNELSWHDENPADVSKSISNLVETILQVAELQTDAQSHIPYDYRYVLHFFVSLHDTPLEIIESELKKETLLSEIVLEGVKLSKGEKELQLIYNRVQTAIMTGKVRPFHFIPNEGVTKLPSCVNDNDEGYKRTEAFLKSHHDLALSGNEGSLQVLKASAKYILDKQIIPGLRKGFNFVKFSFPYTEYLNIEPVVSFIKEYLTQQGFDLKKITIKFPSDQKNDFYFDVVKPYMQAEIDRLEATVARLSSQTYPFSCL